jgi:hypothetical protein
MEIKCPVKAEIDYYYEIERKEYSDWWKRNMNI